MIIVVETLSWIKRAPMHFLGSIRLGGRKREFPGYENKMRKTQDVGIFDEVQ